MNFWQRKTLTNLANHWWLAIFSCPMSCDINKESKQTGIHLSFPPPTIHAIRGSILSQMLASYNSTDCLVLYI